MILSFWRKIHLTLALTSCLFLLITSLTGVILSFKPIQSEFHRANVDRGRGASIANLMAQLDSKYSEVIEIEIDDNNLLQLAVITLNGEYKEFYADPSTGLNVGEIESTSRIFNYTESLHKSLFLGGLGRFFIGLSSFLLLLISFSGSLLIIKRQTGIKNFLKKINKVGFYEDWHMILGRITLIFILIIALTGTLLSMDRFGLLPSSKEIKHVMKLDAIGKDETRHPIEFSLFKEIPIEDVLKIEFPFSSDVGDYFKLILIDKELIVNQFNGSIISTQLISRLDSIKQITYRLHTGKGSLIWSIVLCISSFSILFFLFSGYKMAVKRLKSKKKNIFSKDKSSIIILVGSEGGNTMHIAKKFQQLLIKSGKRVYLDELNNYDTYSKLKQLIVFTSTYGDGEAPVNANQFILKLQEIEQKHPCEYSIIGFGSTDYIKFCQFAKDISSYLSTKNNYSEFIRLTLVNQQSIDQFDAWKRLWLNKMNIQIINSTQVDSIFSLKNQKSFEIVGCSIPSEKTNHTFLIELDNQDSKIISGDLIAVTPPGEKIERYYSIGKTTNGKIIICARVVENGICSLYLSNLSPGSTLKARVQKNPSFNFPKKARTIITISNGTGIAPFIGMASENTSKIDFHVYWGGKSREVLNVFQSKVNILIAEKNITAFNSVFSEDENQKVRYVQDLLLIDESFIIKSLMDNSVILICGSIAMRDDVITLLNSFVKMNLNLPISYFQNKGQLLIDCY